MIIYGNLNVKKGKETFYIPFFNGNIEYLSDNECFVFGSNLSGRHGKGAAKTAYKKFGAKYGCGEGVQGKSYGIPTVNATITDKLSLDEIENYVNNFIKYAKNNSNIKFLVTAIGTGLAGYEISDIALLFKECISVNNIILNKEFVDYISNYID